MSNHINQDNIQRKLHELGWLHRKQKHSVELIKSSTQELEQQWVNTLRLHAKEESARFGAKDGISASLTFSVAPSKRMPDHIVMWELDSLIIDSKRFFVNSLHLIDMSISQEPEDTSLQFDSFLNHMTNETSNSKLTEYIKSNHPDFVIAINGMKADLQDINSKRSFLEHGQISGHMNDSSFTASWGVDTQLGEIPDEITKFEIHIGKKPVAEYAQFLYETSDNFGNLCLDVMRKINKK